jgi:putative endonuclease
MVNEPWFCYMLRCSDGSLYVGITSNLAARVERHNQGFGPEYTRKRRPVMLIWSQEFADSPTARRREMELKGWNRKKKLALVPDFRISEGIPGQGGPVRVNPSREIKPPAQGKGE